ncbi:beta-galactosidase [Pseudoalteromonas sp. Z1A6]|uniref:beta-galactosidase n=1 Tax=Pseudoalteromonas sp. Z1A6 TaxID=2686349 RepID=UPI001F11454B|nr:beta-galactosidase [Pseudoalteromonas sp. Z1A6]
MKKSTPKTMTGIFSITSLALAITACNDIDTHIQNTSTAQTTSNSRTTDAFSNEQIITPLMNFNDSSVQSWFKHSDTNTSIIKTDQATKLAIDFSSKGNISELKITPSKAWDLSTYKNYNVALNVENTANTSIQLYLSIENKNGELQSRSVSLPANYNGTVYFPLDGVEANTNTGMWADAPPWETKDRLLVWRSWRDDGGDFSKITAINLFTIGILEDKSVLIDNIRLRKNPKTDPNWMVNIIDKYGQYTNKTNALTIKSDEQLKQLANKELSDLAKSSGMANRSRFGGYANGPKLKATGYFRTEKVDGKWWMVDPEGYLFFSHGPANVRMANLTTITGVDFKDDSVRMRSNDEITPEDSMGIIEISDDARKSRFITSKLRNNMFQWLPDYSNPLSEHYSYRRSTHKGPVAHGETYSFYRANLQRRYGEESPKSYIDKWHDVTLKRMKDWGFTSFGNWVDPAFYDKESVPYFANGWIIGDFKTLSGHTNHWGLMPDFYDPEFKKRAEITIDAIAKNIKASPWCIGIFIDNEKSWGERQGSVEKRYGIILDALSKSAKKSPAKHAFAKYLKQKYSSINELNKAWQSDIASWNELNNGVTFTTFSNAQIADISKMLEMLGEQYFKVVNGTLAKKLPNHLYMGARMANWGMPDEIIKASVKYSDVLSFNIYEEGMQDNYWQFLEDVDLPVVIGEFHIGTATDSGLFNPGIVHAANQADRASMYKKYMQSVLSKPYMVGAHWFQYVDEPVSGRAFDGENANIGFVTTADVPYPEMVNAVKEVTSTMYEKRYNK